MNSIVTLGMFPDGIISGGVISAGGGGVYTKIEKEPKPKVIVKLIESKQINEQTYKGITAKLL